MFFIEQEQKPKHVIKVQQTKNQMSEFKGVVRKWNLPSSPVRLLVSPDLEEMGSRSME